jgi:outer membrane protein OmpA-like peptidoglycan-associated protein
MISQYITPDVVQKASSAFGENPAATAKAFAGAIPVLLGGVVNMASTGGGASRLMGLLQSSSVDSSLLNNVSSMFSGGSTTQNVVGTGQQLLGTLFGNNSDVVTSAISKFSGVSSGTAGSLMALVAPMIMGVLRNLTSSQGLNANGLASMLMGQKSNIAAALPPGLSNLPGLGNLMSSAGSVATSAAAAGGSALKRWLPILAVAIAAIALFFYSRGCNAAKNGLAQLKLPNGQTLSVPEGSFNYTLAQYLANGSNSELPKTFVFDNLNFNSGTTQLTPDSQQTVSDLIVILGAYPNAQVQLVGHTDNTGDAAANQKLSLDRANAVRDMVVSKVPAARITTAGYGSDKPIASNDTEEGRAKNRRTELVVQQK